MSDMRYAVTLSASEVMGRVHVTLNVWEYPADPNRPDKKLWKRAETFDVEGQPASADWVQNILLGLAADL